jgi:hypothetical protein
MTEETQQPREKKTPPSRAGKAQPPKLPDKVRRFVVTMLACYERHDDVRKAALEQYGEELKAAGVELTRDKVRALDPTQARGQEMSPKLKEVFWETRKRFDAESEEQLIGDLRHRRSMYRVIADRALAKGNEQLALQALKQAAQDAGGVFTNRRELSGPKGGPVETVSMSLEDWKATAAARSAEVADTMAMFDEGGAAGAPAGEDGDA